MSETGTGLVAIIVVFILVPPAIFLTGVLVGRWSALREVRNPFRPTEDGESWSPGGG